MKSEGRVSHRRHPSKIAFSFTTVDLIFTRACECADKPVCAISLIRPVLYSSQVIQSTRICVMYFDMSPPTLLISIALAQLALAAPWPQSYSDGSDSNPHAVDTDAGASGSSTSFNISKGGIAAIIIVVVLVIIFGGRTSLQIRHFDDRTPLTPMIQ